MVQSYIWIEIISPPGDAQETVCFIFRFHVFLEAEVCSRRLNVLLEDSSTNEIGFSVISIFIQSIVHNKGPRFFSL